MLRIGLTRVPARVRSTAAGSPLSQARTASPMLERFPISLIVSDAAPLLGAAHLWLDERERGWL